MTITITQDVPATSTVVVGNSISITTDATSSTSGTLTYAWYIGTPTTTPSGTSVGSGTTLLISNVTVSNAGSYYCVISSTSDPTVVTSACIVTVVPVLTITTQPVSATAKVGKSVSFTIVASGGLAPYAYQWYQNGSAVNGATSATYTIASPTKAMNAAQITCVVTDASSQSITSTTAILTVKSGIAWWVWLLIAGAILLVLIIIIVIIVIIVHGSHKKSVQMVSQTPPSVRPSSGYPYTSMPNYSIPPTVPYTNIPVTDPNAYGVQYA